MKSSTMVALRMLAASRYRIMMILSRIVVADSYALVIRTCLHSQNNTRTSRREVAWKLHSGQFEAILATFEYIHQGMPSR